jgi:hypothetical protein
MKSSIQIFRAMNVLFVKQEKANIQKILIGLDGMVVVNVISSRFLLNVMFSLKVLKLDLPGLFLALKSII